MNKSTLLKKIQKRMEYLQTKRKLCKQSGDREGMYKCDDQMEILKWVLTEVRKLA